MNFDDEVLNRIRTLEVSMQSVQMAQTESIQKFGFCFVVLFHGFIAVALTLLSSELPVAFINGWFLGAYCFALIWFEASPRSVVDRALRLALSSTIIFWMLLEAKHFSFGMILPDVSIFAFCIAPFSLLVSRWTLLIFQTFIKAPDIPARTKMPKLAIADFLIATTLFAVLFGVLRPQEAPAVFKLLTIIVFAMIPSILLALMLIFLARFTKWFQKILIVFFTIFLLAVKTWVALAFFGEAIQDLSWIEPELVQEDIYSVASLVGSVENHQPDFLTVMIFSTSVMMPWVLTLWILRYHQGYRLISPGKARK